jgi:Cu-Zn family superoxide dismutase
MTRPLILLASLLALSACTTFSTGPSAVAQLQSTSGNTATGMVSFTQSGDKVVVSGTVSGLKPNAEHGFHLHDKGDCSSKDGMSAGGHFNPGGQPHGHPGSMAHHAGDLPSLKADANGVAKFSLSPPAFRSAAAPTTSWAGR